jgi:hypothetical protein
MLRRANFGLQLLQRLIACSHIAQALARSCSLIAARVGLPPARAGGPSHRQLDEVVKNCRCSRVIVAFAWSASAKTSSYSFARASSVDSVCA